MKEGHNMFLVQSQWIHVVPGNRLDRILRWPVRAVFTSNFELRHFKIVSLHNCGTSKLRHFTIAPLPNCLTSQLRHFQIISLPNCGGTSLERGRSARARGVWQYASRARAAASFACHVCDQEQGVSRASHLAS